VDKIDVEVEVVVEVVVETMATEKKAVPMSFLFASLGPEHVAAVHPVTWITYKPGGAGVGLLTTVKEPSIIP